MAKESLKKCYAELDEELTKILNSQEIVPELNNEDVVSQLLKSVKICEYLEDKLEIPQSERKSYGFLKIISNYYAISNIHVDSYYFIDEPTLVDDVNYLKVYVKNVLKKDYKFLTPRNEDSKSSGVHNVHQGTLEKKEGTKSAANSYNQNSNAKPDKPLKRDKGVHDQDVKPGDEQYNYADTNNDPYGGMGLFGRMMGANSAYGIGGQSGYSPEDQMAATAASVRLQQDISFGRIYMYARKPKFILWLKWAAGIFLVLLSLFAIIQAIMWSVSGNIPIPLIVIHQLVPNSTSNYQWVANPKDGIFNGLFTIYATYIAETTGPHLINGLNYIYGYSSPLGFFFWIMIIVYVAMLLWEAYRALKPQKNLNEKYRIHWGWLLFLLIVTLFFWIPFYTAGSGLPNFIFKDYAQFMTTYGAFNHGQYVEFFRALYGIQIFFCVCLCLLSVFCLVAYFLNPKRDDQYLNDLYNTYYEQAKEQFAGAQGL